MAPSFWIWPTPAPYALPDSIVGERFLARDITFQNTAGPSKHQAVALQVGADLSALYLCDFLAYQDTLHVHSNRQFFVNCLIAGIVDFIFGNSAAVFQNCDMHARRPNSGQKNMVITAQGRIDPNQNNVIVIVIHKSMIGATKDLEPVKTSFPTFLGRPWKEYSRTVIMQSTISDVIDLAGWHEWEGDFALNTLFYGEYQNARPSASTSGKVVVEEVGGRRQELLSETVRGSWSEGAKGGAGEGEGEVVVGVGVSQIQNGGVMPAPPAASYTTTQCRC